MRSQTTNTAEEPSELSCRGTFTLPEDQDQDQNQRQGKETSAPGGTKPFPFGESGPEIDLDKNHLGSNLWCIQGCMKEQTARSGTEHRKRPAGPKKCDPLQVPTDSIYRTLSKAESGVPARRGHEDLVFGTSSDEPLAKPSV